MYNVTLELKTYMVKKTMIFLRHVVLALRAHFLLEKDTDYVVTDKGEVVLLDKKYWT